MLFSPIYKSFWFNIKKASRSDKYVYFHESHAVKYQTSKAFLFLFGSNTQVLIFTPYKAMQ